MKSLIYDIEIFPNVFTCCFSDGSLFEISWIKNEVLSLIEFISTLDEMIGFNNVMFDYPIIHFIIENNHLITPIMIFNKSKMIIDTPFTNRYSNIIWDNQRYVKQIDLYMMHHFDNAAKSTSLKALQIAMCSESVEDLPFKVGKYLTCDEIDELIEYNRHDVKETLKFWNESKEEIDFRRQTCIDTGVDVMNFNDTKIGKKYFENELEKSNPGCCYGPNGKRQTLRKPPFIFGEIGQTYNNELPVEFHLPTKPLEKNGDFEKELKKWNDKCIDKHEKNVKSIWVPVDPILFNYVQFDCFEFKDVLQWYRNMNIIQTKGGFSKKCTVNGFDFYFGAGGIHGSMSKRTFRSNTTHVIRDIDVASYYPNLAIKNNLYPEHLGLEFCRIYQEVFQKRKTYKKGTTGNKILKLALNGTYGDSNNPYSPFFDPQYTMSITINGQLLLAMLVEKLIASSDVELIQVNTDGLTIRHPRCITNWIKDVEHWWMELTKLELENTNYKSIFVRDVNNYIGLFEDEKLKRKGAYEHEREWHQDRSGLVIQKAVEDYLIRGTDVKEFIYNHSDKFDFMMRGKVNSVDRLVLRKDGEEVTQQKTIRFYFSKDGGELIKYMPPLKKNPDKIRRHAYQGTKGRNVKICNHVEDFQHDVDFDYYVKEAFKLIESVGV